MGDRVDDGLSHCDWRQIPSFCSARGIDGKPAHRMLLHKCKSIEDSGRQMGPNLGVVKKTRLVCAKESSDLDPGIRKVAGPVFAKEKEPADGGHFSPLMPGDQAQG